MNSEGDAIRGQVVTALIGELSAEMEEISELRYELKTGRSLLGPGQLLTLSCPRVINFKFLLQPHQKYYITQYEEVGFS